jgi:anti-sigma B factor antagonist
VTQQLISLTTVGPGKIGLVRETITSASPAINRIRVGIDGNLVHANRDTLKQQTVDQLERGDRDFVLDLTRCKYIDSAGLGVIVSLARKVKQAGGEFVVEGLNEDLRVLFELTRLDQCVTIRQSEVKHV